MAQNRLNTPSILSDEEMNAPDTPEIPSILSDDEMSAPEKKPDAPSIMSDDEMISADRTEALQKVGLQAPAPLEGSDLPTEWTKNPVEYESSFLDWKEAGFPAGGVPGPTQKRVKYLSDDQFKKHEGYKEWTKTSLGHYLTGGRTEGQEPPIARHLALAGTVVVGISAVKSLLADPYISARLSSSQIGQRIDKAFRTPEELASRIMDTKTSPAEILKHVSAGKKKAVMDLLRGWTSGATTRYGEPVVPEFGGILAQAGGLRIPSGKELVDLGKRFNLLPQQLEAIKAGDFEGLPVAITNAITGAPQKPTVAPGEEIEPGAGVGIEEAKKFKTTEEFVKADLGSSYADVKGINEDEIVTVYRASEKGGKLSAGNFVTTDRQQASFYAKDIVGQRGGTEAKIISQKVRAGDLRLKKAQEAIGVDDAFIYRPKTELTDIWNKAQQPRAGGLAPESRRAITAKLKKKGITTTGFGDMMRLESDVTVQDKLTGNKVTLKKGHELFEMNLSNGQVWLHDGKDVVVNKSQLANVEGHSTELGEKEQGIPGTQEVWKGADVKEVSESEVIAHAQDAGIPISQARQELPSLVQETKFEAYQTPGGENYRELVVTAPEISSALDVALQDAATKHESGQLNAEQYMNRVKNIKKKYGFKDDLVPQANYISPHWDEPNVLFHIRMNDRMIPNENVVERVRALDVKAREALNLEDMDKVKKIRKQQAKIIIDKKVLFIEEIQSDWAKAVRGSVDTAKISHPALKNWHEQAVRKALEVAVREGYDAIAWTTGEQQAARYDLSKQIDNVLLVTQKDGTRRLVASGKTGQRILDEVIKDDKDIEKYIGKTPAERVLKAEEKSFSNGVKEKMISGVDLKIGGEWAKNLYDRMIPQAMEKLTGGKVAKERIGPTQEEGGLKNLPFNEADFVDEIEGFIGEPIDTISIEQLKKANASEDLIDKLTIWLFPAMREKKAVQSILHLTPTIKRSIVGDQPMAGGLPGEIQKISKQIPQSKGAGDIPKVAQNNMSDVEAQAGVYLSMIFSNPDRFPVVTGSPIVKNSDYGIALVPDSTCKRGKALTTQVITMREMLDELLPEPTTDEIKSINAKIKTAAARKLFEARIRQKLETPCLMCYTFEKQLIGYQAKPITQGMKVYKPGQIFKHKEDLKKAGIFRGYGTGDFTSGDIPTMILLGRDLAKINVGLGSYTKNLNQLEILGDTGVKFNISTGSTLGIGLPVDIAHTYAQRYPNAGVMYVAINERDLLKAMKDPRIHNIIPAHLGGGTPKNWLKMATDLNFVDFKRQQSEKVVIDGSLRNLASLETGDNLIQAKEIIAQGAATKDPAKYLKAVEDASRVMGMEIIPKFDQYKEMPGYEKLIGVRGAEYGKDASIPKIDMSKANLKKAFEYMTVPEDDLTSVSNQYAGMARSIMNVAKRTGAEGVTKLDPLTLRGVKAGGQVHDPEKIKKFQAYLKRKNIVPAQGEMLEIYIIENPVSVKDVFGDKHKLTEGEDVYVYPLTKEKFLIKDGDYFIAHRSEAKTGFERKASAGKVQKELKPLDVTTAEGQAVLDAYAVQKDLWIGEKDIRILQTANEKATFQESILKATGKKRYDQSVKDIDKAIQIYLDLKRNPDHLALFRDKLTNEQAAIVNLSQNLPEEIKAIADQIDKSYQALGLEALEEDVIRNVLDNYVARKWDLKGKEGVGGARKFKATTGHAKHRKLETILEGWANDLELKIEGATNNLAAVKEEVVKTIEDKKFLKTLRQLKSIDGAPLLTTQQLEDYVQVEHPNFKVWQWTGQTRSIGDEAPISGRNFFINDDGQVLERKDLYAPKYAAQNLNNIMGISRLKGIGVIDFATKYNAVLKAWILQSSFFHHLAFMRSYYLGTQHKKWSEMGIRTAYQEGLKAIREEEPIVMLGVRNGLTLGIKQDWNEEIIREKSVLDHKLDQWKVAKAVKDKVLALRQQQADFLFGKFGAGLKAKAFLIEYRNLLKKHPNMNINDLAKMAANLINDDFGGLHLQRLGRNPTMQHIFRLLALAPDWTESNVRTMIKAINAGSKEETAFYRKFWAGIFTKGVGLTVAGNLLLATIDEDDSQTEGAWQRFIRNYTWIIKRATTRRGREFFPPLQKSLDIDVTAIARMFGSKTTERKYFSILGHFTDPVKFMLNPIRSAHHKGSVIYKFFHEMLTGVDWAGRRFTTFPEFLGVDYVKGVYATTRKGKYKKGDPKYGKLTGKTVTWSGDGGGPISYEQFPSFILSQIRGWQPVQIQNLMSWFAGEMEGFDSLANSAGLGVRTTYGFEPPAAPDSTGREYIQDSGTAREYIDSGRNEREYIK